MFEETLVDVSETEQTMVEEPEFEQTADEEPEGFVCPMCGTEVSADASECSGCGEPFSPIL